MEDTITKAWGLLVEYPLHTVGLLENNFARFAVFTIGTYGFVKLMKPRWAYTEDGEKKPNALISSDRNAVIIDSTVASLLVGISSVLFV